MGIGFARAVLGFKIPAPPVILQGIEGLPPRPARSLGLHMQNYQEKTNNYAKKFPHIPV
jgi:hypothetical protein